MLRKTTEIPFNLKQAINLMYGIKANSNGITFISQRNLDKKANIPKTQNENKDYNTFGAIRKI